LTTDLRWGPSLISAFGNFLMKNFAFLSRMLFCGVDFKYVHCFGTCTELFI
jgi:hypothetical protein